MFGERHLAERVCVIRGDRIWERYHELTRDVSRWSKARVRAGSFSRLTTLSATGMGAGCFEPLSDGGWYVAVKTVDEAPKPIGSPRW